MSRRQCDGATRRPSKVSRARTRKRIEHMDAKRDAKPKRKAPAVDRDAVPCSTGCGKVTSHWSRVCFLCSQRTTA